MGKVHRSENGMVLKDGTVVWVVSRSNSMSGATQWACRDQNNNIVTKIFDDEHTFCRWLKDEHGIKYQPLGGPGAPKN